MRQTWTDDRMDDLVQRVDNGFAQVDARFERVHADMGSMRRELRGAVEVQGSRTGAQGTELRNQIGSQGSALRNQIESQGVELRNQIENQGIELRKQIESQGSEFRAALDRQGVELRQEMAALRSEMQVGFRSIQRMVFPLCAGLCFALIAAIGSLIATQI